MSVLDPDYRQRRAAGKAQQRTTLSQFLVGVSNLDTLKVHGYTTLANSPDVVAGVNRLADIVSDATIHLMRNTADGDERVEGALAKFMDISPYTLGSRKTLVSWIVSYMFLQGDGNAFAMPVTQGGYLKNLRPMPGAFAASADGGESYYVSWRGQKYAPDEVLHFVLRPNLTEPYRGAGVRLQLADVLGNLRQAAATTKSFLSDKWKPSIIVKVDAEAEEFSDPEKRKKFLDEYMSGQEAGEPWIIPSDLFDVKEIRPLSLNDLAISDTVKLDKLAVAAAIGVPPFFLGVGDFNKDEYNNCIRTTATGLTNVIQLELTKKLLLSPDMYYRFNSKKLYAYDMKELEEMGSDMYVRGLMTGNEVRNLVGFSPKKDLNELVMLENYIPAGSIGDQKKLKDKEAKK